MVCQLSGGFPKPCRITGPHSPCRPGFRQPEGLAVDARPEHYPLMDHSQTAIELALIRHLATSGKAAAIRDRAALTLTEMAAAIDVSPTTLRRWERGERAPRGPEAQTYLRLLQELVEVERTVSADGLE